MNAHWDRLGPPLRVWVSCFVPAYGQCGDSLFAACLLAQDSCLFAYLRMLVAVPSRQRIDADKLLTQLHPHQLTSEREFARRNIQLCSISTGLTSLSYDRSTGTSKLESKRMKYEKRD